MVVWKNDSCFPFWRKLILNLVVVWNTFNPVEACCSWIASWCYGSSNVRKPKGPTTAGWIEPIEPKLGDGFTRILGKVSPIDEHIFQMGWNVETTN